MTTDKRQMIHDGGESSQGQMGHYSFEEISPPHSDDVRVDQPVAMQENQTQSDVMQVHRQPRATTYRSIGDRLRTGAKIVKYGALAVAIGVVAKEIHDFGIAPPEAKKEIEVEVGPAKSVIAENVFVNLNTITSKFPLRVETSLDRFGPSNCDVKIIMTEEDEQVKTTTNTGIIFDSIETNLSESGDASVFVRGDVVLTPSSVLWSDTPIKFEEELSPMDACFDFNEPNQAMDIAVTTVLQAGQLAGACAVGSEVGQESIEQSIREYVRMNGTVEPDTADESISVQFENIDEQQDALYGRTVQEFDKIVDQKIKEYVESSKKHKISSNFEGIKDCSQHEITVSPDN